jgi:branched-chain amino acid transport system substrate-binding protein
MRFDRTARLGIAVVILAGFWGARGAAAQDVHVGLLAPLTGPAASYGMDIQNGVNLAATEINEAGGIGGRHLVIDAGDDRGSPQDAANVTQKFVSDSQVVAMLGGATSTATFGAVPVAQRGKLPFVITLASHPDLTKEGDYIFRNSATQDQEGPALAKLVTTCLAPKTIAIMHLNNDWGMAMTASFVAALKPSGIKIVADESYNPGQSIDYAAVLTKIKSANPDVLWFGSQYDDLALILKQAEAVDFDKTPLVASSGDHSTGLIKVAGAASEGLELHTMFFTDDPSPVVQAFVAKFQAKYKQAPNIFSVQAYDALKMLAIAIKEGGGDRAKIRDAIAHAHYDGVGGTVAFDATRNATGKRFVPLVIKDQKFSLWTDCAKKMGL